ncbi:MAG: FAD-dependent oxidoreductase [Campylobacterota bacterium]|nr:FAD-dependent oxidoreductase [Campylobacterota bacterium]
MNSENTKIAIVGGGVAGSSIAVYLSEIGLDVTLFEKGDSLVDGPPICHLHAGGNLYREISDEQCITLLKQSIDLLRFFPYAVDYRPTVIAVPIDDDGKPENLFKRLHLLQNKYKSLIELDLANKVLGEAENYFKIFHRDEIEFLKTQESAKRPKSLDEWMIPVAKNIDLEKIRYPLVMVQEYGLNIFRIAATLSLCLDKIKNAKTLTKTKVKSITKNKENNSWILEYISNNKSQKEEFDFVINAAGFRSGEIDDMLNFKRDRLVEFKAAYVTKWSDCDTIWPEVIFHGKRGTPKGMAQFTPYPDCYFQLHGMTNNITLFEDGLVESSQGSAQPQLDKKFIDKIAKGWKFSDVKKRSKLAVEHMTKFIPNFANGEITSKPLYGAQQIPGKDATLRASDVSFVEESYARCEIVKASSVLSMADDITKQLIYLNYIDASLYQTRDFKNMHTINEKEITKYSESLCKDRGYPNSLAHINTKKQEEIETF